MHRGEFVPVTLAVLVMLFTAGAPGFGLAETQRSQEQQQARERVTVEQQDQERLRERDRQQWEKEQPMEERRRQQTELRQGTPPQQGMGGGHRGGAGMGGGRRGGR